MKKITFGLITVLVLFSSCIMINSEPDAVAGDDFKALTGSTIILDGSESYDWEYDELSFRWDMINYPVGSAATAITNYLDEVANFTPDLPGDYTIRLTVEDYQFQSSDEITITAKNIIADAGEDSTLSLENSEIILSGLAEVLAGKKATYSWEVTSYPSGASSSFTFDNENTASPSFTALNLDSLGTYTLSLSVSDGINSDSDSITLLVTAPSLTTGPTGVSTSSSEDSVSLSWSSVNYSEGYKIYRSTSKTSPGQFILTTESTFCEDTTATPGVVYYYSISAYNSNSESPQSSYVRGMRTAWKISNPEVSSNSSGDFIMHYDITAYGAKDITQAVAFFAVYADASASGGYSLVPTKLGDDWVSKIGRITSTSDYETQEDTLTLDHTTFDAEYRDNDPILYVGTRVYKSDTITSLKDPSWDQTKYVKVTYPSEDTRSIGGATFTEVSPEEAAAIDASLLLD